jgi:hypothetical protein
MLLIYIDETWCFEGLDTEAKALITFKVCLGERIRGPVRKVLTIFSSKFDV